MANKLSNALALLVTAIADGQATGEGEEAVWDGLVKTGVLKAVKRDVLNPLTAMQTPVLGIKMVRYRRETLTWVGEVLLTLVTKAGESADDEANVDLAAKVDAMIERHALSGSAGCGIGCPTWDPWEHRPKADAPLVVVGSVGSLEIRVDAPLLVEDEEEEE